MGKETEADDLQLPPEDEHGLAALGRDFPQSEARAGDLTFRAHDREFGPWFFGSSMKNRFDLAEPLGTCYLALDRLTAIVEVLLYSTEPSGSGIRLVPSDVVEKLLVRQLELPRRFSLADLTVDAVVGFGLDREISSARLRSWSQAWAEAFRASGRGGIVYGSRRSARGVCLAIFGRHGERTAWKKGRGESVGATDREGLREQFRILIIPRPSISDLSGFIIA